MNNSTAIKLGGITNLTDARYAAAVGVTYLGFCFDPSSPDYLPPIKAKEIMDWISGCHFVGEFGKQPKEEITEICSLLNLEIAEVFPGCEPADISSIIKLNINHQNQDEVVNYINSFASQFAAFHLFSSDKSYNPFNDLIKSLCETGKIIWGFELNEEHIKKSIKEYKPFAINLHGGVEEKPGLKNLDVLESLLNAAGY